MRFAAVFIAWQASASDFLPHWKRVGNILLLKLKTFEKAR
jgi:hypothetical protein